MIRAAFATLKRLVAPWADFLPLIAVIVLAFSLAFAIVQVRQWRADSHELAALKPKLADAHAELTDLRDAQSAAAKAFGEATRTAAETAEADRRIAQEIERDLTTRIAAADRTGRDLARRLLHYQARPGGGALSGLAGAASLAAGGTGEPEHGQVVELATAEHFGACAGDADRLAGWREWYGRVCRDWKARGFAVEGECP